MILAIGDSNMYPACTEQGFKNRDVDNFVSMFASQANLPFRCWAKNGASNYWIEHHLQYFMDDVSLHNNTVLLIGWTSVERQEWPWLSSNVSVCAGPDFGVPDIMRSRFEKWKASITGDYLRELGEFWHTRIYGHHLALQKLGIRHRFFNAYESFHCVANHQDWQGCFFRPYDTNGDMYHYLVDHGVSTIKHDPFHFDQQGHALWAQTLYQHAASSGIL
jgi:hypothetical protein